MMVAVRGCGVLRYRSAGWDERLKAHLSADNRLIDTNQMAREGSGILIRSQKGAPPEFNALQPVLYDVQDDQSLTEHDGHRAPGLDHLPSCRELTRGLIDAEGHDRIAVLVPGVQERPGWVETEVAGRFTLS